MKTIESRLSVRVNDALSLVENSIADIRTEYNMNTQHPLQDVESNLQVVMSLLMVAQRKIDREIEKQNGD